MLTFNGWPIVCCCRAAHAGLKRIEAFNWNGAWQDGNGGIISIREAEGFLDVTGKDKASTYRCTCLITKNGAAKCFGEGTNHEGNFRYLYQSTLFFKENGSLDEAWEALSTKGNLAGRASFTKVDVNSR